MSKFIASSVSALLIAASPALADGFYISGSISGVTLDHSIERNNGGADAPGPGGIIVSDTSGTTLATETGAGFGIGLGYEQSIGNGLFWGAEAFYTAHDINTTNLNGVLVTDLDLEATYGARGIFGAEVTDRFNVYAHVGIVQAEFDVDNSYTFAPPSTSDSFEETGVSYGVGASYAINDQIGVFAEYTQIADIDFDGIGEVAGNTGRVNPNDLDLSSIALGVKYSF